MVDSNDRNHTHRHTLACLKERRIQDANAAKSDEETCEKLRKIMFAENYDIE